MFTNYGTAQCHVCEVGKRASDTPVQYSREEKAKEGVEEKKKKIFIRKQKKVRGTHTVNEITENEKKERDVRIEKKKRRKEKGEQNTASIFSN